MLEPQFIKGADFRPTTLLKRDPSTCFPVNIAKFLKTIILKKIYKRLLLLILAVDIRFEKEAVKHSEIEYCHVNIFML